jgi:hypothetical protein
MPVFLSCGAWSGPGWFLQWLGGQWRWYAGGISCDGGKPECGRWIHLAATVDGQDLRLFQDGALVAHVTGAVRTDLWPGNLVAGTYGAIAAPEYQVCGQLAGIRLYHRVLAPEEIAAVAQERPAVVQAAAR